MKQKAQVLVVDDERVWLDQLADSLTQDGYQVRKAANYKQAMKWLDRQRFHLAVVDVNLADAPVDNKGEPQDTSGLNFIAEIRKRAIEQDMSVIIVTGFGTFKVAREALKKLRVHDIILKEEFNLDDFLPLAREAIALAYSKTLPENS